MPTPTTPTLRACVAALIMTTALAASPLATAGPNDVLVAVQPAGESLTRATQERLVQFIEWTFKAPLTPSQRARLGEIIVAEWRLPKDREGLKEWLAAADHIDTLPADQRPFVREKLLEEVLPALRAQAKTDADARWFIALYDAANKPIAAGNPALTRQMSDATIEMTYFILGKAHGADLQPSAAEKDDWAKALVAGWPRLAAERKREIAGSPLQWAEVRASWDAAKESDRAEVAALWRKDFPLPAAAADAPLVASPAQRAALAKLKDVDAYLAKPAAEWRADHLTREADALAKLAAQLRKEPAAARHRRAPGASGKGTARRRPAPACAGCGDERFGRWQRREDRGRPEPEHGRDADAAAGVPLADAVHGADAAGPVQHHPELRQQSVSLQQSVRALKRARGGRTCLAGTRGCQPVRRAAPADGADPSVQLARGSASTRRKCVLP
jgi:hypothetical protein